MAYGHASGADLPELFDSIRAAPGAGLPVDPDADRACPGINAVYGVAAQAPASTASATTTSRPQRGALPAEEDWDTRAYLRHLPGGVRGGPQRVRPRAAAAARRAPPDDADPGRASWARPSSRTTCSGSRTARRRRTRRRCAWSASTPRRRWRSARSSTPSGTTRPSSASSSSTTSAAAVTHTGGITRRCEAARLRRAVPDQVRHARPDRHLAGRHGRRDAPRTWRSTTSASRSTCSTARETNEVFQQSFTFERRLPAPGRQARARRRARRRGRGAVPVRAGLPAVQPPRRRHGPRLVTGSARARARRGHGGLRLRQVDRRRAARERGLPLRRRPTTCTRRRTWREDARRRPAGRRDRWPWLRDWRLDGRPPRARASSMACSALRRCLPGRAPRGRRTWVRAPGRAAELLGDRLRAAPATSCRPACSTRSSPPWSASSGRAGVGLDLRGTTDELVTAAVARLGLPVSPSAPERPHPAHAPLRAISGVGGGAARRPARAAGFAGSRDARDVEVDHGGRWRQRRR